MKGSDMEDNASGLHMTTLEELVAAMTVPSIADFRNMQFIPSQAAQQSVMEQAKAAVEGAKGGKPADMNSIVGGDDEDEDDDGGLFG
jgi:hypothetical protein